MKNFLLFIFAFLWSFALMAQAEKTLVQSIDLEGHVALAAVFNGEIEVVEWDKNYVRVTTQIKVENSNEMILGKLVSVGRYEIDATEEAGELILTMPKAAKTVNLRGEALMEGYKIQLNVPKSVSVRTAAPAGAGI